MDDIDSPSFARLRPRSLAEIRNWLPRRYLIKGLLGTGEMSVWYGNAGCGKSFLMLETARCIATDQAWFNRKVTQGAVLYVMCEGGGGAGKRIEAMCRTHGVDDKTPIHFIQVSVRLLNTPDDVDAIIHWAEKCGAVMVIIDTLNRAMNGGSENDPKDMGDFIRSCDEIRASTGAHVAIVHHNGTNQEKKGRGHTSLEGAADTMLLIKRQSTDVTATVTKNKDDEDGWNVGFQLKAVDVGIDEDGDTITSCAVIPADVETARTKSGLTGHKACAMEALHATIIQSGKRVFDRPGFPDSANCVGVEAWRTEFYSRTEGTQETKQKAFSRSLNDHQDNKRIGIRDDLVWIIASARTDTDAPRHCPDLSGGNNPDRHGHTP